MPRPPRLPHPPSSLNNNQLNGTIPAGLTDANHNGGTTYYYSDLMLSGGANCPLTELCAGARRLRQSRAHPLERSRRRDLSSNLISGSIPSGGVTGLVLLNLAYNDLQGTIPDWIGQNAGLTSLCAQVWCPRAESDAGPPPGLLSLTHIHTSFVHASRLLSYNDLSGPIPAVLANLTRLTTLDLSVNKLTSVPSSFDTLPRTLTSLQLQYNLLGVLPDLSDWLGGCLYDENRSSTGYATACTFRFDSNLLNGSFPMWILDTALTGPFASGVFGEAPLFGFVNNQFTGPLPPLFLLNSVPFISVGGGFATTCPAGAFVSEYSAQPGIGCSLFPAPICVGCPPGHRAGLGSAACSPCPLNTFAVGDGQHCQVCPVLSTSPAA